MEAGDLVFFNPFDNHACEEIDNKILDYRCLNIKPEILQKWTKEMTYSLFLQDSRLCPLSINPIT
ncbi:AraC family ligand binding domain-containing protein [Niallia sp. 03133]|uniref:AraC family ligand binding domain-containing protein n=1 Tax=Niallia sp. 03133 TaxID=3458060 RepID=UPI00404515EF